MPVRVSSAYRHPASCHSRRLWREPARPVRRALVPGAPDGLAPACNNGRHAEGETILESFRLAGSHDEFEHLLETPQSLARAAGAGLGEYLRRALSHRSTIAEPKDLAWLLASYARDGLTRVEAAGETASLAAVRSALEDALGVRFEGERGARFFRSTLVQTLFYGVFSAGCGSFA